MTTFANRGYVKGTASGIASQFSSLMSIGFSNSAAQYWSVAMLLSGGLLIMIGTRVRTDSAGAFTSPKMKAGTYTMTCWSLNSNSGGNFSFYSSVQGRTSRQDPVCHRIGWHDRYFQHCLWRNCILSHSSAFDGVLIRGA